jgi:site-specific recombinase XerD
LEDENYIKKNPVRKLKKLKEPHRIKKFFSELEIEKLRDSCKTKRELALVDLLISSGLRIGEIPKIKLKDINWDNGSFTVIGKGNKERICYLNVKAKKHVREYIDTRNEKGLISDYLFCRERKLKNNEDKPLCKEEIGRILKNIGNRCAVCDIHVHGIRAYFATNLSNKGVTPTIIQSLMGHESYSTTVRYYCNQNTQDTRKAVSMYA